MARMDRPFIHPTALKSVNERLDSFAAFALFGGKPVSFGSGFSRLFSVAPPGLVLFQLIPTVSPRAAVFRTSGPLPTFVSICEIREKPFLHSSALKNA